MFLKIEPKFGQFHQISKLRNKLRRRILPIQKITGKISENDIIKYKDSEIGKILIDKPYSFALVKVVEPDLKEFTNIELNISEFF